MINNTIPVTNIANESTCDTRISIPNNWNGKYRLSVRKPSTIMRSKPYHTR